MLKDFSTVLAVIINLVMVASITRNKSEVIVPEVSAYLITYGGLIQGISSFLLIIFYISARGGLITKSRWRQFIKENSESMEPFENEDRLETCEMSIHMTHRILMTKGPDAIEFQGDNGERDFGNSFTKAEYYMYNFIFFIEDATFIYYVLYFMVSLLGFIYLDIFYALHLFDFVTRSPTLQNIIRAVTENFDLFAITSMLFVIILYIYANIGFFYLQIYFIDTGVNKYEDKPNEGYCNTLT